MINQQLLSFYETITYMKRYNNNNNKVYFTNNKIYFVIYYIYYLYCYKCFTIF